MKEKIVRTARKMKPDRLMFYEDFAQRTLQRRRELIPELIRKRKQGKQAFIVMDRIVEYDIDQNEPQAWTQFEDNIKFVVFFILFYFLQFINNASCNI